MTDDRTVCGSTDTFTEEPCQRAAGWGTDSDHGPCKTHRGRGRPSKLTHQRQEAIAAEIEDGTPVVAACRKNGIARQTHNNWYNRGERESGQGEENVYTEYFARLARALGHDQSKKTDVMWDIAEETGDTATMLTVLKQRYPETWQDQDIGEAKGGIPMVVPKNAVPNE